ncbi:MAG: hypothetical protein LBV19_10375 [Streptococcaceae bacterium]|jgi:Mg2+/citrate symporter|nr:hypothetical protein [Streptococcaceae bacterium]
MEAREYEYYENETQPIYDERPLAQSYVPLTQENKRKAVQTRKSQRRELSFFLHVSTYAVLFSLLYPIFQALVTFIIAFPIALFLPIGIILGAKQIFRKFVFKK